MTPAISSAHARLNDFRPCFAARVHRCVQDSPATLAPLAPDGSVDELALFAAARGVDFALIVLDRGRTRSQPMLTVPGKGTLAAQVEAAGSLSRDLRQRAGFRVVRVKVEATPWNEDVPADDAAAVRLGDAMHFEHHVKVVLDDRPGDGPLPALLARHGARLSRNARRRRADERDRVVRYPAVLLRRPADGGLAAGLIGRRPRECRMAACLRRSGNSWCTTTRHRWTMAGWNGKAKSWKKRGRATRSAAGRRFPVRAALAGAR